MKFALLVITAVLLANQAKAAADLACPAETKWAEAAIVETKNATDASVIRIEKFSNALLVQQKVQNNTRRLIQLDSGVALTQGGKPMSFLGVDTAAGLPFHLLSYKIDHPCLINGKENINFTVKDEKNPTMDGVHVSGWVERRASVVNFSLLVDQNSSPRHAVALNGEWVFTKNLIAIPSDTRIEGWQVFQKNSGVPDLKHANVTTLADVK